MSLLLREKEMEMRNTNFKLSHGVHTAKLTMSLIIIIYLACNAVHAGHTAETVVSISANPIL